MGAIKKPTGQLTITWAPAAPAPVVVTPPALVASPPPPAPPEVPPAPPAGPDPIEVFLERCELKGFSPHTVLSYITDLGKAQRFVGRPLLEATRQELDAFLQAETRRGMNPATVGRRLNTLRSFFKWTVDQELLLRDPTRTLTPPKRPKLLPRYLRAEDIDAVIAVLREDTVDEMRATAIFLTFLYTGMRISELVGLDCEAVRGNQVKVFGKGSKERQIPISDQLRVVLDAWLAVHPGGGTGPLFTTLGDDPGRLQQERVRAQVKRILKRAGLGDRKLTPHKLRHTFATRLINKGMRIDIISRLLGHASIATTQIYTHTEFGDEVRQQLGEYL